MQIFNCKFFYKNFVNNLNKIKKMKKQKDEKIRNLRTKLINKFLKIIQGKDLNEKLIIIN